jgi:hypothetical protein
VVDIGSGTQGLLNFILSLLEVRNTAEKKFGPSNSFIVRKDFWVNKFFSLYTTELCCILRGFQEFPFWEDAPEKRDSKEYCHFGTSGIRNKTYLGVFCRKCIFQNLRKMRMLIPIKFIL